MHGIFGLETNCRGASTRWLARTFAASLLAAGISANASGVIYVTDAGAPSSTTCTLAQGIAAANAANNAAVVGAAIGSATVELGTCDNAPSFPMAGDNTLIVSVSPITLTTIDNYWYGANALPPIASPITIAHTTPILELIASHTGDPTPATANAFRFFYISGGFAGELPGGALTLLNATLRGGYAKGGDSGFGAGGAGMGGAIFNQGTVALTNVSLIGNTAQGGSTNGNPLTLGGGGIGQDAPTGYPWVGGGFGGALGASYGGSGAGGNPNFFGGGGGGGFITGSNGTTVNVGFGGGAGGGLGGLGGPGLYFSVPVAAGDGGGGGDANSGSGSGGGFGQGGGPGGSQGGGGGGGVGGGGGGQGGGGGFGAGAGWYSAAGGFGGGGGKTAGFGGGNSGSDNGGAGAGMGGAIFNHTGTVALLNVTANGNAAKGGTVNVTYCSQPTCQGSGLGAVLFNLNGTVTIDFSTLAGNVVAGTNAHADAFGPEDASVYSLAYGNKIQDGSASSASLKIHNSIVHGTHADAGAGNDILVNIVDGMHANASSVVYTGKNFVQFSTNLGTVTQTGSSPTQADPLLGALSIYSSSTYALPVIPIGSNSPAYNTATSCLDNNNAAVGLDERGAARPYAGLCDVGAYEFDEDYIFANGIEPGM
jgi:hypothetical protein